MQRTDLLNQAHDAAHECLNRLAAKLHELYGAPQDMLLVIRAQSDTLVICDGQSIIGLIEDALECAEGQHGIPERHSSPPPAIDMKAAAQTKRGH